MNQAQFKICIFFKNMLSFLLFYNIDLNLCLHKSYLATNRNCKMFKMMLHNIIFIIKLSFIKLSIFNYLIIYILKKNIGSKILSLDIDFY